MRSRLTSRSLWFAALAAGTASASVDVAIAAVVSDQTPLARRAAAMAGWNALTGARGIAAAFLMSGLLQAGLVDVTSGLLLCAVSSAIGVALFVTDEAGRAGRLASLGAGSCAGGRWGVGRIGRDWVELGPEARLAAPLRVGQLARDVAAGIPVGDVAAAIVELLAARETELELRLAAGQVHPQRHDRLALLLGATEQLVDLAAVEQQLARSALGRGCTGCPARTARCRRRSATPRPSRSGHRRSRC